MKTDEGAAEGRERIQWTKATTTPLTHMRRIYRTKCEKTLVYTVCILNPLLFMSHVREVEGKGGHTKKPPSLLWNNIMWQSLIYYTGALDMLWCALYLGWMLSNISLNKILIAYGKQSNFSNSSDKKSFIIFRRIDRPTTDWAAQRPAREYEIRCAKNMRW